MSFRHEYISLGILADVDAGKTTLSEGILYLTGAIKQVGRVDHKNTFFDIDQIERDRGITIYSKQTLLQIGEQAATLLDTPGHADFSTEMERTLCVLDYAILVINASDGVQGQTETLWQLLRAYRIPTFIFINKMDLDGTDREALMEEIIHRLSDNCIDFASADRSEKIALTDENILSKYIKSDTLDPAEIARAISQGKIYPCIFGSALKLDGVDLLLESLSLYTRPKKYPAAFGAKVFKISRDGQGNRLTHMKITGGTLKVKAPLSNRRATTPAGDVWEEKADQIRIYSGERYELVSEAGAGSICAVTGLSNTYAGEGLGVEPESERPMLEPVLTYKVIVPEGENVFDILNRLKVLEEEDPQLRIIWNSRRKDIHIRLMGDIQLEILQRVVRDRFGIEISFGTEKITYRETIQKPVIGVGHFEPLRHYAEVHLLLEPGARGSGLVFDTVCSEDKLSRDWQRLVLTHLAEKNHVGVLTGSPITDMKITLLSGRAHEKHTTGGDFRQATYRAVRQGLMQAESILLEPYFDYRLTVPGQAVGRAMTDLQNMDATIEAPEMEGDSARLTGRAPVSTMRGYLSEVKAYTRGKGRLTYRAAGYDDCHKASEIIENMGYDPESDPDNTPDSVFCTHGAGYTVRWSEVPEHMHIRDDMLESPKHNTESTQKGTVIRKSVIYTGSSEEDAELLRIFERTYGPIKDRRSFMPTIRHAEDTEAMLGSMDPDKSYLLVDGYNIIFAWDRLKDLARDSLDLARQTLINTLSNYRAFKSTNIILVFDAYKVTGGEERIEKIDDIYVVYTREAEIADIYIEKAVAKIPKGSVVRVATSDHLEQLIVLGKGALRLPASAFILELENFQDEISLFISNYNRQQNYSRYM